MSRRGEAVEITDDDSVSRDDQPQRKTLDELYEERQPMQVPGLELYQAGQGGLIVSLDIDSIGGVAEGGLSAEISLPELDLRAFFHSVSSRMNESEGPLTSLHTHTIGALVINIIGKLFQDAVPDDENYQWLAELNPELLLSMLERITRQGDMDDLLIIQVTDLIEPDDLKILDTGGVSWEKEPLSRKFANLRKMLVGRLRRPRRMTAAAFLSLLTEKNREVRETGGDVAAVNGVILMALLSFLRTHLFNFPRNQGERDQIPRAALENFSTSMVAILTPNVLGLERVPKPPEEALVSESLRAQKVEGLAAQSLEKPWDELLDRRDPETIMQNMEKQAEVWQKATTELDEFLSVLARVSIFVFRLDRMKFSHDSSSAQVSWSDQEFLAQLSDPEKAIRAKAIGEAKQRVSSFIGQFEQAVASLHEPLSGIHRTAQANFSSRNVQGVQRTVLHNEQLVVLIDQLQEFFDISAQLIEGIPIFEHGKVPWEELEHALQELAKGIGYILSAYSIIYPYSVWKGDSSNIIEALEMEYNAAPDNANQLMRAYGQLVLELSLWLRVISWQSGFIDTSLDGLGRGKNFGDYFDLVETGKFWQLTQSLKRSGEVDFQEILTKRLEAIGLEVPGVVLSYLV